MTEVTVTEVGQYTEATHTAWAQVNGAKPISLNGREFTPENLVIKYDWRTQLGDTGWKIRAVEMSGRWVGEASFGSGAVLLSMDGTPAWAQDFARANVPTVGLVPTERVYPYEMDGKTVWACCMSSIGPTCEHRRI